ncbi:MAG: SDR family oxidoreductase [Chloroflexi bacterium]|nr:SDR family oxidoreductase [Chloroflexota bacterium]
MSLAGRVALVTGASRGIGREIALGYARAGAHVILAARDESRLTAVATEIVELSGTSDVVPLDVSDSAAVRRVIDDSVRRHGRLDVLCNNAGISNARGPVAEVSPEAFAGVQAVNLIGLFACCHAALPHMIGAGYGRIVNVSSGAAIMCNPGESAYAASKAAVNALTIAMAKEVEASNVLVNAMSPGSVTTDMNPTSDVPPSEAVPTAVWLASLPDGGPTGRFYRFMQELPMLPQIDLDWKSR